MLEITVEPVAVKRSTAARMLDCGATKIYELEKSGDLDTIRIGADIRITTASIKRFVTRQLTDKVTPAALASITPNPVTCPPAPSIGSCDGAPGVPRIAPPGRKRGRKKANVPRVPKREEEAAPA